MRTWSPRDGGSRIRIVALGIAVAACAACGSRAPNPKRPGAGAEPRYVQVVKIAGNEAFSDDAIIKGLATRPPVGFARRGTRFDELEVDADRKRIVSYYQHRGYFSARVVDVVVQSIGKRGVGVRFVMTEGKRSTIESVEVAGAPDDPRIARAVEGARERLEVGAEFDHARYLGVKKDLHKALVGAAYAHARTDGVVAADRDAATVAIRFEIDSGPLVTLGAAKISGLRKIPESAVTARISWDEGDTYDSKELETTRARLYKLGVFSAVRVEVDPRERAAQPPVLIGLVEAPRRQIRLGIGVRADQAQVAMRARAGYSKLGFGPPLQTLSLSLRPGYALVRGTGGGSGFVGDATVSLRRDDLWAPMVRGTVSVGYAIQEREAYASRGPDARANIGRTFADDRVIVGAGWQFQYLTLDDIDALISDDLATDIGLVDPYRLGFFEQTLAIDGRDYAPAPRSGYYAELRLEESNIAAGSAFSYVRATPDVRVYAPLGSRVSVAARARFGTVLGGSLPVTQRYFGGGSASHRGFPERQLSPFVADPDPDDDTAIGIGGEALVESSVETRIDVARLWGNWFGVAGFVDAGDVTASRSELDLSNLHLAVGAGIRYRTAIGPIRLDLGYRLNRTGAGEPREGERWTVHLGLGEAF